MDHSALYPHALLGFRHWVAADGLLYPLVKGHLVPERAWTPGVNTAVCLDKAADLNSAHTARVPVAACRCGFHAEYRDPGMQFDDALLGTIAARGEVRMHAQGFRCRQAQIIGLLEHPSLDATGYARRYRVPVFSTIDDLETYSRALAKPATKEMLAEFEAAHLVSELLR